MNDRPEPKKSGIREYLSSILIAIGLALVIRAGVVQAFFIPSGSMEDTLLVGDYLLANKFVYGAPIDLPGTLDFYTRLGLEVDGHLFRLPGLRDPAPRDIVIFRSPTDAGRDLIKRCVAVGGQEVKIVDKVLYVDDQKFADPPQSKYTEAAVLPAAIYPRDNFGPLVVPADHFFMMGDNRDNSHDSRYFKAVPRELIKGKAMIIYWSWGSDYRIPFYNGITSLPRVVGGFLWSLPARVRYSRLGNVIY